ncbi:MAG: ABC transporter permease [Atopobiaceae bacterium]|jgi:putative ABC transport system permease protein|nr:ABC transporter permease [Atopobiaceae bacterium]MCH4214079.1 ABC transporter permease [Atopobiaceae bacterium]MCH4229542.1 ABC transporter permease [Atopobiaceae bacterium]MCH4276431.1 ABC transporter permease [Atopobiaceae bacterium]MCI1226518.1 ABC transporter permease [Atopobiaceae bacterium]
MFFRLALGNVRRSLRDYAIYFVTIALGVAVFYAFNTISNQAAFLSDSTNTILEMLSGSMTVLTVFLAMVLGFLMVYANNFLIKRRKRELGLYQMLGMTRGQVSRVISLETLLASVASFAAGILVGVLASQLLVFVTASLFHDSITQFTFMFSPFAFFVTLGCFGMMFVLMLLLNLRTISHVKLVDLMGAEHENEHVRVRSLPVSLAMFAAGVGLIIWAYVRLEASGLPVYGPDQYQPFLITTGIVCAGTFLLFFGLSGALVTFSRMVKSHYYHGLAMFTTRQLSSRITSASASMSVICLVLFLAITSVTGGMSICTLLNQDLEAHTPYDASVTLNYYDEESLQEFEGSDSIARAAATRPADLAQLLASAGLDPSTVSNSHAQVTIYWPTGDAGVSFKTLADESGASLPSIMEGTDTASSYLFLMSQSDYNSLRSAMGEAPVDLGQDGYLITSDIGDEASAFYDKVCASGESLPVNGHSLHPLQSTCVTGTSAVIEIANVGDNSGTIVVPDSVVSGLTPYSTTLNLRYSGSTEDGDAYVQRINDTSSGTQSDTATALSATNDGRLRAYEGAASTGVVSHSYTKTEITKNAYGVTGTIAYMAVYIGFVLVISCAAILAIQQLSDASDSAPRYRTLSELGCSRAAADRSLLAQTLFYFLFPLGLALLHSVVALRSVTKVVSLFGHLDITSAAMSCGVLFLIVYGSYLVVTYLVARGVVSAHIVKARG